MSLRPPYPGARPGSTLGLGEDPATALEAASWALAAMIATMCDALTAPLADVLAAAPQRTAVLEAAGLVERNHDGFAPHPTLRLGQPFAEAKLNSLRQAFSVASHDGNGAADGWGRHDDDVLLRHGRGSAAAGRILATKIVPGLPGLADRLNVAGSRILDVGTGVGAIAVVLAREFPRAHVVGIDILERALDLARAETTRAADVAGRVSLRHLDVADLAERAAYDLIWLPAPFLAEAALRAGLPRVIDAVVPGGWIVAGTNLPSDDAVARAVGRWTAVLHDGNAYDTDWMAASLTAAGLQEMQRFPTVKGGPVLLAARRPAS